MWTRTACLRSPVFNRMGARTEDLSKKSLKSCLLVDLDLLLLFNSSFICMNKTLFGSCPGFPWLLMRQLNSYMSCCTSLINCSIRRYTSIIPVSKYELCSKSFRSCMLTLSFNSSNNYLTYYGKSSLVKSNVNFGNDLSSCEFFRNRLGSSASYWKLL